MAVGDITAFPGGAIVDAAISTGVYGYPRASAGTVAFRTIASFAGKHALPGSIWLVFHSEAEANALLEAISPEASRESPGRTP